MKLGILGMLRLAMIACLGGLGGLGLLLDFAHHETAMPLTQYDSATPVAILVLRDVSVSLLLFSAGAISFLLVRGVFVWWRQHRTRRSKSKLSDMLVASGALKKSIVARANHDLREMTDFAAEHTGKPITPPTRKPPPTRVPGPGVGGKGRN